MLDGQILIKKLLEITQNIYLLKISFKSLKQLIQVILLPKVFLMKMVHKGI